MNYDDDKSHWRDRLVPIKSMYGRIEPPEPEHRPPPPSPGWVAFAYRLGIEPRCPSVLFHWRGRMFSLSYLQRRREVVAEFKQLHAIFTRGRRLTSPLPSDPASRLVRAPRRGAGMLGFRPGDLP